jgi:sodium-dependent dicarboxylate transporter 2/3/5
VGFFELSWYMFPIGWLMVFLLWGFFMVFFKPEKATIPGLREKARELNAKMGPITRQEILAAVIVLGVIGVMSARAFVPELKMLNKTAIILVSSILFFVFKILDLKDLEDIPWNIILLFAGAMSIGFCLWQTGAAKWMAVNWLVMFQDANWFIFVMSIAFFVMIMTNFIMNVAAIAISLPVALVIAPYLGVAPDVILYAALVTAGMPFLLLVGAAPNAIAYDSGMFSTGEFFAYGIPASIILMVVVGIAALVIWPIMGMPVTLPVGG